MNSINQSLWFSKTTILFIVVIDSCITLLNVVNLFYKTINNCCTNN